MSDPNKRLLCIDDGGIEELRRGYPDGLHFAVGDLHGEAATLMALIDKIHFDPARDHVYFVGDYNSGGNPRALLSYLSQYYSADLSKPGFHMIRGNHERELFPDYPLENLPDVIVHRGRVMVYYIAHAGMVSGAFRLINADIAANPGKSDYAYAIDESCAAYGAQFRDMVWSARGLYWRGSGRCLWPDEYDLYESRACIIHGHTPYSFMRKGSRLLYGGKTLFFERQRAFFSEDLQSFDIDSNVKGRFEEAGDTYRGLTCVCLEALDEIAEPECGRLTLDALCEGSGYIYGAEYTRGASAVPYGDTAVITRAKPEMKTIRMGSAGKPEIISAAK